MPERQPRHKLCIAQATALGYIEIEPMGVFDASYPGSTTRRGRVQDGGKVSPALTAGGIQWLCVYLGMNDGASRIRKSVGFTRSSDPKGRITKYHIKEYANCVTQFSASNFTTAQYVMEQTTTNDYNMNTQDNETTNIRIRKLTPRECFRLMDVDDDRIDAIQATGISKTQQYKMAGNSIVVACLYHIFDKLFFPTAPSTDPTWFPMFPQDSSCSPSSTPTNHSPSPVSQTTPTNS